MFEVGTQARREFDRNFEARDAGADHGRIEISFGMELAYQCEIFGPSDEELHRSEVGGIQGESSRAVWNRNQSATPTLWQGFQNRVSQDIRVVAVAAEVGAVFPKGFFKHEPGEFVERLRAKIRIVGGGEGRGRFAKFWKRHQQ